MYNSTEIHNSITFFGNSSFVRLSNRFDVPITNQNQLSPPMRKAPNKIRLPVSETSKKMTIQQRVQEDCRRHFYQLIEKHLYLAQRNPKDSSKILILIKTINEYFNHYCSFKEVNIVEAQ